MATSLNSPYTISAETVSVPASVTKSGTMSVDAGKKVVTGSSTLFNTELGVGGWLVDTTNYEVRKVISINSVTELVLESGFTNALSGVAVKFINSQAAKVQYIEINPNETCLIDGVSYTSAQSYTDGQSNIKGSRRLFCKPVIVNASAATAKVKLTMYSNSQ